MSHKELNELVYVLRWLLRDGNNYFRREAGDDEREIHGRLVQAYDQLTDTELEATTGTGLAPVGRFLHARPILKGHPTMFPVIKIGWHFKKYLTLGIHVGLFELGDVDQPVQSATGWRFETPSSWSVGDDNNPLDKTKKKAASAQTTANTTQSAASATPASSDAGLHEYFHAQAITGFEKGQKFPNLVEPINSTQPAFRLEAWNTPSLSVNALISLYGRDNQFFDPLVNSSGSVSVKSLRVLAKVADDTGGPEA